MSRSILPVRACVAPVVLAVLTLVTGCAGGDEPAPASPRPSAAQPTPADAQAPAVAPLILHGDGASSSCLDADASTDLAYFDVSWKATTDLDSVRFTLIDPIGVRQVGAGLNVPPVNFGGRIDYGGSVPWDEHAEVLDNRWVSWPQHRSVWTWTPIEGETGLLVLHLRVDRSALNTDEGASFGGVTAYYRTSDGSKGSVSVHVPNELRRRGHC